MAVLVVCVAADVELRQLRAAFAAHRLRLAVLLAVYCHIAYLTYMQGTSCEMPERTNHKLESRWPGKISTTSAMQMIPL